MNRFYVFLSIIICLLLFTACETAVYDYTCECSYTVGTMQGSDTYNIPEATAGEAEAECDGYEEDLGGNTKCELEVED